VTIKRLIAAFIAIAYALSLAIPIAARAASPEPTGSDLKSKDRVAGYRRHRDLLPDDQHYRRPADDHDQRRPYP
jgi:hypothetical protein